MPKYLKNRDAELLKEHGVAIEDSEGYMGLPIRSDTNISIDTVTEPVEPPKKDILVPLDKLVKIFVKNEHSLIVPNANEEVISELKSIIKELNAHKKMLLDFISKSQPGIETELEPKKWVFEIERDVNGRMKTVNAAEA